MIDLDLVVPAVVAGLTTGAIYALVALGLTLIYGVLHIINFAHGSLLMVALYGVFFLHALFGIDPYLALPILVPAFFVIGYALQRGVIMTASHGKDQNILLVTLGLAIIIDNLRALSVDVDDAHDRPALRLRGHRPRLRPRADPARHRVLRQRWQSPAPCGCWSRGPISAAPSAPLRRSGRARGWSASMSSTSTR